MWTEQSLWEKNPLSNSFEYIFFPGISHLFKHCTFLFFYVFFFQFFNIIFCFVFIRSLCACKSNIFCWSCDAILILNINIHITTLHIYAPTSILFMFGLSLLNVRNSNNINVNFSWFQWKCFLFCFNQNKNTWKIKNMQSYAWKNKKKTIFFLYGK